ncbi:hypothetical protein LMG18090_01282 [Ralstonia mannitolilytica]|uniref:hypothetical protein n=1 Tax=Ralstonia mannitolilytica TaxID=105219 RepID=UPI0028F618E0|nr:hypothetical protein [Ralstonia mannitolilytica]CAJ0781150.1 hypothetical protein LMG18090_01282 [Ralstonia mannitolilytica]
MGQKALINTRSLLEVIERAPISALIAFCELPECRALGSDWALSKNPIASELQERVARLGRDEREAAEREALRVLRLASPRGAKILRCVIEQVDDADLTRSFLAQVGGELGRVIWVRTHSDDTMRLFEVAESILNTADVRGCKRLYEAFVVAFERAEAAVDLARTQAAYRRQSQRADLDSPPVRLNISSDGYAALLCIPGKTPWRVTGKAKIAVLKRLVDALTAGTPHVNTKRLMEGTGCTSPANLFSKTSPWRDYLVKVAGAHAWQLNVPALDAPLESEATEAQTLSG